LILYIHGFRTTYDSFIATLLKKNFENELISSDHSHEPLVAIKQLEEIIKQYDIRGIIASSLGGYYATYLGSKYNLKTILINPSVNPHKTTIEFIGQIKKHDDTTFEWTENHLKELSELWVEKLNPDNFYIFLKRGDQILDYKIAKDRYKNSQQLIEDNGDHRFSDIQNHIDKIKLFLTSKEKKNLY